VVVESFEVFLQLKGGVELLILLVLEKGLERVLTYLVQGDEGRAGCHVCRLGPGMYSPTGICFN